MESLAKSFALKKISESSVFKYPPNNPSSKPVISSIDTLRLLLLLNSTHRRFRDEVFWHVVVVKCFA